MVEYLKGDLVTAEREALVNTVNCVGVMGRGVALAFKRRFPANFKAYKAACEWGEVELGRMFVFETGELMPRFIINSRPSSIGAAEAVSRTSTEVCQRS